MTLWNVWFPIMSHFILETNSPCMGARARHDERTWRTVFNCSFIVPHRRYIFTRLSFNTSNLKLLSKLSIIKYIMWLYSTWKFGEFKFNVQKMKLARNKYFPQSMFNIWYMDDGRWETRLTSSRRFWDGATHWQHFGLLLNEHKCELVTNDMEVVKKFRVIAPTIIHVDVSQADLFGAPIGRNRRCSYEEDLRFPAADLQTETALCTGRILSVEELFQSA